jgi:hypothetical protein
MRYTRHEYLITAQRKMSHIMNCEYRYCAVTLLECQVPVRAEVKTILREILNNNEVIWHRELYGSGRATSSEGVLTQYAEKRRVHARDIHEHLKLSSNWNQLKLLFCLLLAKYEQRRRGISSSKPSMYCREWIFYRFNNYIIHRSFPRCHFPNE